MVHMVLYIHGPTWSTWFYTLHLHGPICSRPIPARTKHAKTMRGPYIWSYMVLYMRGPMLCLVLDHVYMVPHGPTWTMLRTMHAKKEKEAMTKHVFFA